MKSSQFLTEAQRDPAYALFESLRRGTDRRTQAALTRMHENFVVPYNKYLQSINQLLVERELTPAEINQLFTGAAQGAQASGTNSTMIGRLLPDAIKKKFEAELPAADAGPVEGFEQKAAQAVQQIQDPEAKKTAGQMVQMAMKNPVVQRLVIAALSGALAPAIGKIAGSFTGPMGGAVAGGISGGLLAVAMAKMQGQSWKDAGISGLKGAAVGAVAGGLGSWASTAVSAGMDKVFGGGDAAGVTAGEDGLAAVGQDQAMQDRLTNKFPPEEGYTYSAQGKSLVISDANGNPVFTGDIQPKTMDMQTFADLANQGKTAQPQTFQGGPDVSGQSRLVNRPEDFGGPATAKGGNFQALGGGNVDPTNDPNSEWYFDPNVPRSTYVNPADGSTVEAPTAGGSPFQPGTQNYAGRQSLVNMSNASLQNNPTPGRTYESRARMIDREQTVRMWYLRESVGKRRGGVQLTQEGIGDVLKSAGEWVKTKAGNLTQKVTPDKIQQAYKKAGSPTDSDKVYQVLKDAGVDPAITDKLYADMGIPMPGAGGEQAADPNAATGAAQTGNMKDAPGRPTFKGAPDAATQARIDAAPQGYDPETGQPLPAGAAEQPAGAKKRLGYNDGKAAVDQMIDTLKKVRSEYRAKVVAHATSKLGELNKAPAEQPAAEQPAAGQTDTAPVTGTPGVQGAVAQPAAPQPAAGQPDLTDPNVPIATAIRQRQAQGLAAESRKYRAAGRLIRDFSRFVDRAV